MITGGYYEPYENIDEIYTYKEKIRTFKNTHPDITEEFQDQYVKKYLDPEKVSINEPQYILTKETEDINKTIVEISTKIKKLNDTINTLNITVNHSLKENVDESNKITHLDGLNNSSKILIDNSKELYKDQYVNNITQVLGIFILIFFIFYFFSKPNLKT